MIYIFKISGRDPQLPMQMRMRIWKIVRISSNADLRTNSNYNMSSNSSFWTALIYLIQSDKLLLLQKPLKSPGSLLDSMVYN